MHVCVREQEVGEVNNAVHAVHVWSVGIFHR